MQKWGRQGGGGAFVPLRGTIWVSHVGPASLPQLSLFVPGQWLTGTMEAAAIAARACDRPAPSREILLFPAIPEELSRGPGRPWTGYTAAPGNRNLSHICLSSSHTAS